MKLSQFNSNDNINTNDIRSGYLSNAEASAEEQTQGILEQSGARC